MFRVKRDEVESSVVIRGKPVRKASAHCKVFLSKILTTSRVMCLFCDRFFHNAVNLQKHTNRYHRSSDQTTLASQNYHSGCSFCNNKSLTVQKSDDLSALFHHLLDVHSLNYFGCRICQQRFLNSNQLNSHNQTIHPEIQKTVNCDDDVISFSAQLTTNETGNEQTSSDSLPSSLKPIETGFDLNPRASTKRICLSTRSKRLTSLSKKDSNLSKNIKTINKNPPPTCSQEQIDKSPVEIKCHSTDSKTLPDPIIGVEMIDKPLDAMPEKTDEFKEDISENKLEILTYLGLTPTRNTNQRKDEPPVFSGEWQGHGFYICCVCGIRTESLRLMEVHQASQDTFPKATYFQRVGKEALDKQLYKHVLHIPGSHRNLNIYKNPVSHDQSTDMMLRSTGRNILQKHPCTNCGKLLLPHELHKHIMLECCRNNALGHQSIKKCKNKYEEQSVKDSVPKPKLPHRPRTKPNVKTIQRVPANLVSKRTSKQVKRIPSPKTRQILNNQSCIPTQKLSDSKIKMRRVNKSITNKKKVENKPIENNTNTPNEITSIGINDVVNSKKYSEKSEENKVKTSSTGQGSASNSIDLTGLESIESKNDEDRSLRKRPNFTSIQPSHLKAKKTCPQSLSQQASSDGDDPENTYNNPNAEPSENKNKQNVTEPSEINVPRKSKRLRGGLNMYMSAKYADFIFC